MFQFPSSASVPLCIHDTVTGDESSEVSPFGHPRIKACLQLPEALSLFATSFVGS